MDRLKEIISADPKMCESSRNVKHPCFADEAAKTKKDDSNAPKKVRISRIGRNKSKHWCHRRKYRERNLEGGGPYNLCRDLFSEAV